MRFPVGNGSKEDFERNWYVAQAFKAPTNYGYHEGADLNLRTGGDTDLNQEIKAIAKGKLVYYHFNSHPNSNFGRHLVYRIDGPWGSRWVHKAHCGEQDFMAKVQDINEGQIVARVGKSGTPYAHLHWAIFKVDPVAFGIDNVANNLTELNQYWEDPIAFVNTWMSQPTPDPLPPVGDQSKYDFGDGFGIIELQAARSIMQAQKMDLISKNKKLTDGATSLRNLANQFEN